ncbi:hypothetical protein L7F22_065233 [Adiantum nelumboides]|nr:hypothetical protein [Adiantum nelumboides]
MSQATQQVLPTIDEETLFHKGDAMSTQEVVEHESDFVAQKPSNDMNKGSENILPTIGETQIHEGNTRNSEEKMVAVENQSDVQTSPKPSDDMIIKDTYNMPLRDEEVKGSEKKDEANEEHQGALATTEVQDKVDKGTGKATRNANKAQSIQGRVQGIEGASDGGLNLDPYAWESVEVRRAGKAPVSRYPAQVRVNVKCQRAPLDEETFHPILDHVEGHKSRLKLTAYQVKQLLKLFSVPEKEGFCDKSNNHLQGPGTQTFVPESPCSAIKLDSYCYSECSSKGLSFKKSQELMEGLMGCQ